MYNIYSIVILILFDIPRFSVNYLHQIQVAAPSPDRNNTRVYSVLFKLTSKYNHMLHPMITRYIVMDNPYKKLLFPVFSFFTNSSLQQSGWSLPSTMIKTVAPPSDYRIIICDSHTFRTPPCAALFVCKLEQCKCNVRYTLRSFAV